MGQDIVNKILDRFEEIKMYDAAIEVVKITSNDADKLEYYNKLKNTLSGEEEGIKYINEKYFNGEDNSEVTDIVNFNFNFDERDKKLFFQGLNEFNQSNYIEAKKCFSDLIKPINGPSYVILLTYISLCQYKLGEYTASLRTISNAIDIEPSNANLHKIREQIIDRLDIMESKSDYFEEYYSKGNYMGEIVKHSIELYQKIDNIEVNNKNLFKKIPEYISQVKKLYSEQKRSLEKDLINVDDIISNAQKNMNKFIENEEIKKMAKSVDIFNLSDDIHKVLRGAEILYYSDDKDSELDFSYIVFSYCKAVEMLCREKLFKYFKMNREKLPVVNERSDYNKLGINSYDAEGVIRYSFSSNLKVEASDYLIEINKHITIRKKFVGKEHNMPWEKLKFISHCIKTGKDPIDGTKSAGMLILFYGVYKNYLGLSHELSSVEDLINLSGNLIRLQNERNLLMHSKILNNRDKIDNIREISFNCIEKLCKIY